MGSSSDFIAALMSAVANRSLYSEQHQIVRDFGEKAFRNLGELFSGGKLSISLLGDNLIINDEQLNEKGFHIEKFISKMRRKGIDKLIISSDVTLEDLVAFISGMASSRKLQPGRSISFGIMEVDGNEDSRSLKALAEENLARLRQLFEGVRGTEPLDMTGIDGVVSGLLSSLRVEANVLRVIAPLRVYNEYTYVHSTNVSLLTLFQAESLGITGELLYDIGLSALLHDIGKMFVPVELLEKQSGLNAQEWDIMRKHPVFGARYLSGLHDMPKLAMVVAYQHHMRFDGAGYPECEKPERRQHLVSQMVAISDFFDALRTERPYRRPASLEEIRTMMLESAGRNYSSDLAGHFWSAIDKCVAGL